MIACYKFAATGYQKYPKFSKKFLELAEDTINENPEYAKCYKHLYDSLGVRQMLKKEAKADNLHALGFLVLIHVFDLSGRQKVEKILKLTLIF